MVLHVVPHSKKRYLTTFQKKVYLANITLRGGDCIEISKLLAKANHSSSSQSRLAVGRLQETPHDNDEDGDRKVRIDMSR